jgi:hypothetical protein
LPHVTRVGVVIDTLLFGAREDARSLDVAVRVTPISAVEIAVVAFLAVLPDPVAAAHDAIAARAAERL